MNEVIEWLESPEGERWSKARINNFDDTSKWMLVTIKDDAGTHPGIPVGFIWYALCHAVLKNRSPATGNYNTNVT